MTDKIRIALIMDSISRHNIILTTSISESAEEGKKYDLGSLGTFVSLALMRVPIAGSFAQKAAKIFVLD